jgi:hypothetical protein
VERKTPNDGEKGFFYKSKVLLVVLASIANLISFMVSDCRASSSKSENPTFSLTVENKPLELVLQNIWKSTGYKITVNKECSDLPISASLKEAVSIIYLSP